MLNEKTLLESFGKKIKQERIRRGISQEGLAERTNLHRTYIGMIERAEKNITLINAEKVANALDIKLSKIFRDIEL